MPQKHLEHSNTQLGAALIEFAIVVPLLLLLLIGITEFAWAFYHQNILNKSVQDGARYFSNPLQARKGVNSNPIDTSNTTVAYSKTRNLVIYGAPTNTGSPLLPNADNADHFDLKIYCVEENSFGTPCLSTTQHIQLTADYQHELITGDALSNLRNLVGHGNGAPVSIIPLTASSVLRVEGG